MVQTLWSGPRRLQRAQNADRRAPGYSHDVSHLQAAGRVCDPCADRQLWASRHIAGRSVLLDERLCEGHGDTVAPNSVELHVPTFRITPYRPVRSEVNGKLRCLVD